VALWLAGFTFTEIAGQVQCAYNTVKNIVHVFTTSRRLAPRAQTGAWSKPPKMRIRELLYLKVRAHSARAAPRRRQKEVPRADEFSAPRLLAAVPGESAPGQSRVPRWSRDCSSTSTSS